LHSAHIYVPAIFVSSFAAWLCLAEGEQWASGIRTSRTSLCAFGKWKRKDMSYQVFQHKALLSPSQHKDLRSFLMPSNYLGPKGPSPPRRKIKSNLVGGFNPFDKN